MAQREQFGLTGGDVAGPSTQPKPEHPLRLVLVRPDSMAGRRCGLVIIHRGVASGERDLDLLDALANGLADAGLMVLLAESRSAQMILDDFHRFSLPDAASDLAMIVRESAKISDVDPTHIGVLGWSLGAVAALAVLGQERTISRCCLVNPGSPSGITTLFAKPTDGSAPQTKEQEAAPAAFVEGLADVDLDALASAAHAPLLIVHAGADRFTLPDASIQINAAFARANRHVDRVLIARADHGFTVEGTRLACIERIAAFFTATLSPKPPRKAIGATA